MQLRENRKRKIFEDFEMEENEETKAETSSTTTTDEESSSDINRSNCDSSTHAEDNSYLHEDFLSDSDEEDVIQSTLLASPVRSTTEIVTINLETPNGYYNLNYAPVESSSSDSTEYYRDLNERILETWNNFALEFDDTLESAAADISTFTEGYEISGHATTAMVAGLMLWMGTNID